MDSVQSWICHTASYRLFALTDHRKNHKSSWDTNELISTVRPVCMWLNKKNRFIGVICLWISLHLQCCLIFLACKPRGQLKSKIFLPIFHVMVEYWSWSHSIWTANSHVLSILAILLAIYFCHGAEKHCRKDWRFPYWNKCQNAMHILVNTRQTVVEIK